MKRLIAFMTVCLMLAVVPYSSKAHKVAINNKVLIERNIQLQCPYDGCTGYVFICGDGVRIRTAPSLNSKIIGKENWWWKTHHSFTCLGIVNGFYKIRYKKRVAYVSADYATHWCPD